MAFAPKPASTAARTASLDGRSVVALIKVDQIESIGGLGVIQLRPGAAVTSDCLEIVSFTAGHGCYERPKSLGINLASVVVRQGLGKARALVCIACFVAAATEIGTTAVCLLRGLTIWSTRTSLQRLWPCCSSAADPSLPPAKSHRVQVLYLH